MPERGRYANMQTVIPLVIAEWKAFTDFCYYQGAAYTIPKTPQVTDIRPDGHCSIKLKRLRSKWPRFDPPLPPSFTLAMAAMPPAIAYCAA